MTTDAMPHGNSDMLHALGVVSIKPSPNVHLGRAALHYATKLGWPVFPLVARGKKPNGQLAPNGLHDASTDPDRITWWWTQSADANIGVPTGPLERGGCGLDVIDADGANGITAWWQMRHRDCAPGCSSERWCEVTGGFDIRAEAFTPGDPTRGPGRHVYIPATGKGNTVKKKGASPLDYRGLGGYVVAPPSISLAGVRYTWVQEPRP